MSHLSGKRVGRNLYLHVTALDGVDEELSARVAEAERLAGLTSGEGYNLVRLDLDGSALALLHYPGFFEDPFPALAESWLVEGFELKRFRSIPDLDEPCGRFISFRKLIECGETQASMGLGNLPRQPESWNALFDLATKVLDPVIDWFGMVRLTYGFCSPELADVPYELAWLERLA